MDAQLIQPGRKAVELGPRGWPPANRTLFPLIARWCAEYLRQPDGDEAGEPWKFTRQQSRYLAWWWSLTPEGRWRFRRGTLRLMKGAGKDPLAAVIAAVELCCPYARFAGWDERGYPIGKPVPAPWVQLAAVAKKQTRTTMRLFPSLFTQKAIEEYGIRIGMEIIYALGDTAVIEAVTSNPLALEGGRTTLVIPNEIQNWRENNQGVEMSEAIDGNLAKIRGGGARRLSLCNAHVPGLGSVGELEYEAFLAQEAGETVNDDVMYFAVEAPPDTKLNDDESLLHGLLVARGDSVWLDPERIMADIRDPRTTPSEARRKYLNQVVAAEDAWVWPQEWDAMGPPIQLMTESHEEWQKRAAESGRPVTKLTPGECITLGLDPSKSEDHTALIATAVDSGDWVTLGVWDPAEHDGLIPMDEVDAAVRKAHADYDVVGFFSDVHPFESYVDKWNEEFGHNYCIRATVKHAVGFDMRTREREFVLEGAMRMQAEIKKGLFRHDGHKLVRKHIHNARARQIEWNNGAIKAVTVQKESRRSPRKIDSAPAGILSRLAWRLYCALPPAKKRKKRSGKAAF